MGIEEAKENRTLYKTICSYLREREWIFDSLFSLVFYYNLIFPIARYAFTKMNSGGIPWPVLDMIADAVNVLDIALEARVCEKLRRGSLEHRQREEYLTSWTVWIDVFSILPFDYYFAFMGYKRVEILRVNRLLRFDRVTDAIQNTEKKIFCPRVFNSCFFFMCIFVLIHWNACIYFLLSDEIGLGSDTWVYGVKNMQSLPEGRNDTLARQYIYSFYWSTQMFTLGDVPAPVRNIEFIYATASRLTSFFFVIPTIIAHVWYWNTNIKKCANQANRGDEDGVKQAETVKH